MDLTLTVTPRQMLSRGKPPWPTALLSQWWLLVCLSYVEASYQGFAGSSLIRRGVFELDLHSEDLSDAVGSGREKHFASAMKNLSLALLYPNSWNSLVLCRTSHQVAQVGQRARE